MKIISTIKAATLNCCPKISTSTAQSEDGVCLPRDHCHRSLLLHNRKAQLPVSISETNNSRPRTVNISYAPTTESFRGRSLLWTAFLCCQAHVAQAQRYSVKYIRGSTASPTALGQRRSHTRATYEICSYRTYCHDSHTLTANNFFLAMSPASQSQQIHSEPQLSIESIQR